ncbi:MAG TPA: TerB family tellurite resistance protein [Cyclobacteriaceae bacterium]|nr:TerB family tellurite resistance protein [Cyclobacteriaceae bacterium]
MSVFAKLYFLMVNIDNKINEKELSLGRQMISAEGFSETAFHNQLDKLRGTDSTAIYNECIKDIKKLTYKLQVRCIAWMCVIANSDGFMDRSEWQFIYKLYHKELNIPLDEIMKVQNELIRITHPGAQAVQRQASA